ncbi:MAG: CDP-glucose 4,6-dehydratase [Deltaproteobacteria bacterium]|nr:CDP-glucose 4,6-dehydratase [Myxococcales bacterium]MDP3218722.1 CDP-glucose 4,6-dehydratase [Deltaproteobacteria bacterium]
MNHPTSAELTRAYAGRRVFVTGHTGFKGAWLTRWLLDLGADVTGYALAPDTSPSLFDQLGLAAHLRRHHVADVRDAARLRAAVAEAAPDVVFHLAAQPLVRRSYDEPLFTLETNVMGTAHVLEAVRAAQRPCAAVMVTSDKCYENREQLYGYREDEAMGGHDVYSMSKGASELVIASWRRSFFPPAQLASHGVAVASGRAGNVIGGGDQAVDRIIPDCVRALTRGVPIPVRNPDAVRPWQHVLEPLGAYLLLGARLVGVGTANPERFCEGFNFGPQTEATRPVRDVVRALIAAWGGGTWDDRSDPGAVHEAKLLRLSIEKAWARLGWSPRWGFERTIAETARWYRAWHEGAPGPELDALCSAQIKQYLDADGAVVGDQQAH